MESDTEKLSQPRLGIARSMEAENAMKGSMKASQRVTAIKEVAEALNEYGEWADIDLVLRQFGLTWSERWTGGKYEYTLHHVESGTDEQLLELKEFLLGGSSTDPTPSISDLTGPWRPQRFRLFGSHIHTDKHEMSLLKAQLDNYGIDMFVAHDDIAPTKEWQREIEAALDSCDALAIYLTSNFHDSLWVDQEIGYCMNRRVLVVPLRCGRDPYGFMGRYQGLDCNGKNAADTARDIFDLLIKHNLTSVRMAGGLIGRLEESENYETANRISNLLGQVLSWSPDLLRRLENAYKSNIQVGEAFTAQNVIPRILRQNMG